MILSGSPSRRTPSIVTTCRRSRTSSCDQLVIRKSESRASLTARPMPSRQLVAVFVLTSLVAAAACRSQAPVVVGFPCRGLGPAELLVANASQTTEPSAQATGSRLRVVIRDSVSRRLLSPRWSVLATDSTIPKNSERRVSLENDSVATFDSLTPGRYYLLLRNMAYRPRRGWVTVDRGRTLELNTLMTLDVVC